MMSRLSERIEILTAVRDRDRYGDVQETWRPVPQDPAPWANVTVWGETEEQRGGGQVPVARARFVMRARADLSPLDRIRWDGVVWEISAPRRFDGRAKYISVEAVSRGVGK